MKHLERVIGAQKVMLNVKKIPLPPTQLCFVDNLMKMYEKGMLDMLLLVEHEDIDVPSAIEFITNKIKER